MADENAPERAAAPPKPAQPDPELARLRADAAETAQLRQQMNQVAEMVQSGKLVLKEQSAPVKEPEAEDDSALIDRREMKRALDELKTSAANVIVETATHSARQMRHLAKDSLRGKLKDFDKHELEIDAILEKIPDPRVASDPNTIRQVHKLVRSQHIDEEVEATLSEKRREWETDLRAKGWEPDEIEEEVEERTEALRDEVTESAPREGTRQAKPVARPAGVAPAGNASGARLASARRQAAAPPLTREQRVVAEQFGIASADEWHKYADPNYRHDSMGFQDKSSGKWRKRI